MHLFSPNAFIVGLLVSFMMACSPFVFQYLAGRWKIRVTSFGIFFKAGRPLYQTTHQGVDYVLGWFPFGAYVGLLGMDKAAMDSGLISPEDLPHTFYPRPFYQKLLFHSSSYVLSLCALVPALILVDTHQGISQNLADALRYTQDLLTTLFSDKSHYADFATYTHSAIAGKSLPLFVFVQFAFLAIFSQVFVTLSAFEWGSGKVNGIIQTLVSALYCVLAIYLLFWKIGPFGSTFFTRGEIIWYGLNYISGLYVGGTLLFFLRIVTLRKP